MRELLMGNQAIAMGAIRSGVGLVSGYPGTPSSEILETVAKRNPGHIYTEWSVNEKAAMEVAAGAAYAGMRTMVTMKQVGLNAASDPLMSLAYIGVKGGMVVVVADDPGPISSQTEQDTRHFASFSKLPVFDPSSPEEAYQMVEDAFVISEKYHTPVLFRPSTRICHGYATVDLDETSQVIKAEGFVKDPKWTIFPSLAYRNHLKIEAQLPLIAEEFATYRFNTISGDQKAKKGIATGGISHAYTAEVLNDLESGCRLFKVATPHPFPEKLALKFLEGLEEVLVVEELDPVIEKELVYLCGKYHLPISIKGKLTHDIPNAGENTLEFVSHAVGKFLDKPLALSKRPIELPELPVRPPSLCAGCPHRASFYAVKQAMKGQKAVFSGDIGCYTLGNAKPLSMVDTCLCMGAGITIAQGLHRAEPDAVNFAFVGDSTFFHTGIPGVINAVYNQTDIVLIILDNSTTAMTGHQPHPGTGVTMMGEISEKISISGLLKALGVKQVEKVDPLDLEKAIAAVKEAAAFKGVSAIVFESVCIGRKEKASVYSVDQEKCTGCNRCLAELGCPALIQEDKKVRIEASACYGCSLCMQVCQEKAIGSEIK